MGATDRKITAWDNPIVNEADRPNRSAQSMKEIFDSNSNQLKDALNGLIDDLAAGNCTQAFEAAAQRANIESGDTLAVIFGKMAKFFADAQTAINTVMTGGQSTRYLSEDGTYSTPEVGEATNGVKPGGTDGQIYVKNGALDYDARWADPTPGLVRAAKLLTSTLTIEDEDWTAGDEGYTVTLTVSGMDAAACVVIGPDTDSYDTWTSCGIRGIEQDENEVTLYADAKPDGDVTAQVMAVWNPGV